MIFPSVLYCSQFGVKTEYRQVINRKTEEFIRSFLKSVLVSATMMTFDA
jgi:hypothetical protein